uniref:Multiple epidermal growth factor-like domains protein 10 n=1 Tax=Crassostrea virginica TaxID=6565 RepID=A0A8B8EG93_CRAVI|nr:multiple epidermal growth factor-like domains protein 10 [Crassostrea virginica]
MCCPIGPTNQEECASFCNLTLYWQEEAPCDKCNNGGVFDHHLGRCKCPPTFTGAFCCDPVHCNENPCKHGTCNDTVSPFFCKCKPGYTGIVCNQEIEYTPAWFPYLEYSIISLVGILLLVIIACVSVRVIRAYGRSRKKKKDVQYQNKHGATNGRRSSKKNSIMPKSMDF